MPGRSGISIRHKLQGIVMVSCAVALTVASVIFTLYDRSSFLRAKESELAQSATMIGSISTAALTFDDARSAQEILKVVQANPHIITACLYHDGVGTLAMYRRAGVDGHWCSGAMKESSTMDKQQMTLSQKIVLNGEAIGTIYLEADLSDAHQRLRRFIAVDVVVSLVSLGIAYLLSLRLQRVISRPIQELGETASAVSAGQNYSLRAVKHSADEIGLLCEQFNGMLERIQQRDEAVRKAHDELEQRVAERTAFLNALVENTPLAVMVLDTERKLKLCNPAFERMFQYPKAEILGKGIDGVLITGEFVEEAQRAARATMDGKPVTMVTQRRRKDGSLVEVEGHGVPLIVNAQVVGSLVLYQDVSERKGAERAMQLAKEQAEAASRAKSEFLANMSHEIRTPMNGIMGMTDLVLDTELDAEQREYLDMAKQSAESLLTLINDILDFSKIEAGKLEIERIDFSLRDNLADTLKALSVRAHQKGLELACDIQADVPDALIGDPGRLRQVIVNLVGNAVKFTARGEVIVYVEVRRQLGQGSELHFTIADTGIGIPREKQATIFEPFTQADGSMTRTYGGTGLGLTICGRLVEYMNGKIWVESEVGTGSRFQFTAVFGLQQRAAAAGSAAPEEPSVLRGMNVLVVDDNATNRRILLKQLERWDARPVGVEGGAEALVRLRAGQESGTKFPLILLDAQMPSMDGFALAESIKRNPEWRAATVMMLSSAGQRGDARRCREVGVAAYLTKPVRSAELLEAILTALGQGGSARKPTPGALVTRHSLREDHAHLKILLVEHNPVNQKLAIRLLEKRGHGVSLAGNGEEALAALTKEAYDLIFMDVQMPVMDGLQAAAAIREREQHTGGHVPIVAMTAHAMTGDEERCRAAGMDDYLSKPLRPEALGELLARYGGGASRASESPSEVPEEVSGEERGR